VNRILTDFIHQYQPAVEKELQQAVALAHLPQDGLFYDMLAYHLGWTGEGAGQKAAGKRVRSLMLLLAAEAAGGTWQAALPAAAAVELIHNFSLIHDDIEDNSETRRNRLTLWKKWGIPQAINSGDAMFTLAHCASLRLAETIPLEQAFKAFSLIQTTCLKLTQGQYLDMKFEKEEQVTLDAYLQMVEGKTAALFSACMELGALCAQAIPEQLRAFSEFGKNLGLAFQMVDDWLGIWGDEQITGKPTASDILEGKKTLPILYGIMKAGAFAQRWRQGPIHPEEVKQAAELLAQEGAQQFTQTYADRYTQAALAALNAAQPQGAAGEALVELANWLLRRDT